MTWIDDLDNLAAKIICKNSHIDQRLLKEKAQKRFGAKIQFFRILKSSEILLHHIGCSRFKSQGNEPHIQSLPWSFDHFEGMGVKRGQSPMWRPQPPKPTTPTATSEQQFPFESRPNNTIFSYASTSTLYTGQSLGDSVRVSISAASSLASFFNSRIIEGVLPWIGKYHIL